MATGTTEFIDSTTADAFIPEIWSGEAIIAREQRLVFASNFNRGFEKELKYGDIVNVPSIGNLTAQTKAKSSNAATTYETVTETTTQITVSTWEYSAIALESIVRVQAKQDLLTRYAGKMGYALGLAIDDVLAGLPDDFSNAVGALAVGLTYSDLLRARQYLDDANAPQEDRFIVISPAEEANLMQLDHFINRDYTESLGAQKGKGAEYGYIGHWMDMPVFKSTNVEGTNAIGHDNCMAHKEAVALIVQMAPTAWNKKDMDYFVEKVALEQLHGSKEMRDDHGVFMRGA